MAWTDELQPASWRGVAFKVEVADNDFGRRQVSHEYPGRDEPFTEDLGRKGRTYSFDAYLIGDDYLAEALKLQDECEQDQPGTLVHPYLGELDLVCQGMKRRETNSEGRMCRLQLTFIEAGLAQYPDSSDDSVNSVSAASNGVIETATEGFTDSFTTDEFPSFVGDFAALDITNFGEFLTNLAVNPVGAVQDVAAFFDDIDSMVSGAVSLVSDVTSLASRVTGLIRSVRNVFGGQSESVLIAIRTAYPIITPPAFTTPSQEQRHENTAALGALFRLTAISEQAVAIVIRAEESSTGASSDAFESRDEAIAVRDEIIQAIDTEIENPVLTTAEYQALCLLRTQLYRGVPSAQLKLPSLAQVTPPATTTSLVLAYNLYEDANRSIEISQRNKVKHPGFLRGGAPLQVITDG